MLVVLGTGLLKPNISVDRRPALLAAGHPPRRGVFDLLHGHQPRRVPRPARHRLSGAGRGFRARLTGWGMDPNSAWHWGFGAAGVGMTLGLIQYVLGGARSATAGLNPSSSPARPSRTRSSSQQATIWLGGGRGGARRCSAWHRDRHPAGHGRSRSPARTRYVLLGDHGRVLRLAVRAGSWTTDEREAALSSIVVFFVAAALFWSVFEQAGSTLNLFAERSTRNACSSAGKFPSSWWQSVNAMFDLRPRAGLRVALGHARHATSRRRPTKFALGLIGVGVGLPRSWCRGAQIGDERRQGWTCRLAVHGLPAPHARRAVPEPGRPERDDQARAGANRQPDDGRVVPGRRRSATSSAAQAASFYETMPLPTLLDDAVAIVADPRWARDAGSSGSRSRRLDGDRCRAHCRSRGHTMALDEYQRKRNFTQVA